MDLLVSTCHSLVFNLVFLFYFLLASLNVVIAQACSLRYPFSLMVKQRSFWAQENDDGEGGKLLLPLAHTTRRTHTVEPALYRTAAYLTHSDSQTRRTGSGQGVSDIGRGQKGGWRVVVTARREEEA